MTLIDEETEEKKVLRIVGDYESDLDKGSISLRSPLARAVIGKKKGDSISVETPRGIVYYQLGEVSFS